MKENNQEDLMNKIVSLAKRRGFVFPSSEIYGGFSAVYDLGPLGVLLRNNIHSLWWKAMVQERGDVVGLDSAILMHPKIWEASGHVASFTDPLVDCRKCRQRFAADKMLEDKGIVADKLPVVEINELIRKNNIVCPNCGGELTEARDFNLLMQTYIGPVQDDASKAYLRAETCQGIYVNYKNVLDSMRVKIPFGIAQIGKAFRNEITTKNWIFRTLEFEQAEMQFFVNPKDAPRFLEVWKEARMRWWVERLGLNKKKLRFHGHEKLAHYAKEAYDIEYEFPNGWKEVEGIHNRSDWDLSQHAKFSGQNLSYKDPESSQEYVPYIIETSLGFSRSMLPILIDAYAEEEVNPVTPPTKERGVYQDDGPETSPLSDQTTVASWSNGVKEREKRVVLKFSPALAPYKVAVFPLLKNKPELVKKAREIYDSLKPHFMTAWDDRGNVGKRYYAQDEIGTPYGITVDFQSLEDDTVTVRDRDTMKQERIEVSGLMSYFRNQIK